MESLQQEINALAAGPRLTGLPSNNQPRQIYRVDDDADSDDDIRWIPPPATAREQPKLPSSKPLHPSVTKQPNVQRASPAPSTVSLASTTDYSFFDKPSTTPRPSGPTNGPLVTAFPQPRPYQGPSMHSAPNQFQQRPLQGSAPGSKITALGSKASGSSGGQAAIKPAITTMGNGDWSHHIKAAKGFGSPARPPASNRNPYNVQNGFRPSTSMVGPQRPFYPPSSSRDVINITDTPPRPADASTNPDGEDFGAALAAVKITAEDYERAADPEADMRELLSGAIGGGEEGMEDIKEGDQSIEGFAKGMSLMPHQIRGTRWLASRESGKKTGGILADDMGLGKTVQMLARIVQGMPTATEKKAGFKTTLIIAPLAVMAQWEAECKTKTLPGRLKVTTHHGSSRTKSPKALQEHDVVITTFQVAASEHAAWLASQASKAADREGDNSDDSSSSGERFGKGATKKGKGKKQGGFALFGVKWLRIVVDEAQNIKNRSTNACKAAVALQGKYRWCLSGTPIQNNVEELFSLFLFLRAKPLDNWQLFKERISNPVKEGRSKMAMKRLHVVLKSILLRRTKDMQIDGKPILNLPARTVQVVPCEFDHDERDFYDALEKKQALTFNKYMKAGTAMSNYTSVLTLLLRMRQACDHPALVASSYLEDKEAIDSRAVSKDDDGETDELADLLGDLGVDGKIHKCDICFTVLQDTSVRHCVDCAPLHNRARARSSDAGGLGPSSAKIRMLLKLLDDVHVRSDGQEKTIVFSQFTSFLNLIEPFLKKERVKYVRYDGSMRNDKREATLNSIKTDNDVKVILISFKAGSTGLNLTCCNNVILMDLWWNPALEDQAFDRAHRLGQKRDVNIFKLTVEQTVEDRILTLQNQKRELAAAALSGEGVKNMGLNIHDLMDLFRRNPRHDED